MTVGKGFFVIRTLGRNLNSFTHYTIKLSLRNRNVDLVKKSKKITDPLYNKYILKKKKNTHIKH